MAAIEACNMEGNCCMHVSRHWFAHLDILCWSGQAPNKLTSLHVSHVLVTASQACWNRCSLSLNPLACRPSCSSCISLVSRRCRDAAVVCTCASASANLDLRDRNTTTCKKLTHAIYFSKPQCCLQVSGGLMVCIHRKQHYWLDADTTDGLMQRRRLGLQLSIKAFCGHTLRSILSVAEVMRFLCLRSRADSTSLAKEMGPWPKSMKRRCEP